MWPHPLKLTELGARGLGWGCGPWGTPAILKFMSPMGTAGTHGAINYPLHGVEAPCGYPAWRGGLVNGYSFRPGDSVVAAPRSAPLKVKLEIMLRNWTYPEFKEILYKEAREGEDHIEVSIYKRIYAYLRTLELRKARLSYNKIKRVLEAEIGYAPSKNQPWRWLKSVQTPLTKIAVFDVRRPEVGLIMGLILSDGNERQHYRHKHLYDARIEFYNSDEGIIEEFKEACSRLGLSVYERFRLEGLGRGRWDFEVNSMLLLLLLKRYDEFIVKAPTNVQIAFLRGLWLGDGHIGEVVGFYNTNLKLVATVERLLRAHSIEYRRLGPYEPSKGSLGRKRWYAIHVRATSKRRFLALTGLAESPPRRIHPAMHPLSCSRYGVYDHSLVCLISDLIADVIEEDN